MSIDWSKAPEGATHYSPKLIDDDMWSAVFWRVENNVGVEAWQIDNDTGGLNHFSRPTWRADTLKRMIARPQEWTGTGLPPIGTVCEVFHRSPDEYWARHVGKVVTIVAHDITPSGSKVAVYSTLDDQGYKEYHGLVEACFRPIRTQEQIEAEEREKAVSAMYLMFYDRADTGKEAMYRLYDAGYRKQPKEDA